MIEPSKSPIHTLKTRLRGDLTAAMKRRDPAETALLRQLIAALDNAEAPPAREESASLVRHVFGTGTNEAAPRQLMAEDIRALLQWEIDERLTAADQLGQVGAADRAAALTAEVAMIRRYLAP